MIQDETDHNTFKLELINHSWSPANIDHKTGEELPENFLRRVSPKDLRRLIKNAAHVTLVVPQFGINARVSVTKTAANIMVMQAEEIHERELYGVLFDGLDLTIFGILETNDYQTDHDAADASLAADSAEVEVDHGPDGPDPRMIRRPANPPQAPEDKTPRIKSRADKRAENLAKQEADLKAKRTAEYEVANAERIKLRPRLKVPQR